MYRGRKRQGEDLGIGVLCVDAAGLPAAPDGVPVVTVYDGSGRVVGGVRLPVVEPSAAPAYFAGTLFLNSSYPAGEYAVVYRWKISGVNNSQADHFEVIPGGNADGAVAGLYRYDRPHANHLVNKRRSGKIYRGRNPRL